MPVTVLLVPMVGKSTAVISAIVFSLLLLVSTLGIAFASSGNWVELTRFTGSGQVNQTESFNCDHVEWRLKWSFNPNPNVELKPPLMFHLRVYEVGGELVEFFIATSQTSGTLNYNRTGSFWLFIDEMYVENYTVIIEQNIDSIPEFSSWTILPLLLATTITVILYRKKLHRTPKQQSY